MKIPAWKRLESSPAYQRLMLQARRLIGQELRLSVDLDVDCVSDGGLQYDPSLLDEFSIVYSLGIGDRIEFDVGVIRRCRCDVFAFDPTPASREFVQSEKRPREFRFQPWAAAGEDGTLTLYPRVRSDGTFVEGVYTIKPSDAARDAAVEVPAYSVPTIAEKLGHSRIDLLKMNIQGAEFDVLDTLLDSALRPKQLLVAFHHRLVSDGLKRCTTLIGRLRQEGYEIIAVSEDTGSEVSFRYLPKARTG